MSFENMEKMKAIFPKEEKKGISYGEEMERWEEECFERQLAEMKKFMGQEQSNE